MYIFNYTLLLLGLGQETYTHTHTHTQKHTQCETLKRQRPFAVMQIYRIGKTVE